MKVFGLKGSGWLMTHEVSADVVLYPPQYFLEQLRCLGMTVKDNKLSLSIDENEANFVLEFLNDRGISPSDYIVLIHPGAGWGAKAWPVDSYARLTDYLIENNQLSVIFTGTMRERDLISSVIARMRHKSVAIVASQLRLRQFVALIARSQLLICGDTAALHIAIALGTHTVSLFGQTSAQQFVRCNYKHIALQSTKQCSPCCFFNQRGFKPKCPLSSVAECMEGISVEAVKEAVMKQLSTLKLREV